MGISLSPQQIDLLGFLADLNTCTSIQFLKIPIAENVNAILKLMVLARLVFTKKMQISISNGFLGWISNWINMQFNILITGCRDKKITNVYVYNYNKKIE